MGLFSLKHKVRTNEFCAKYYDDWLTLLNPLLNPHPISVSDLEQAIQTITEEEPRFSGLTVSHYQREVITLWFEVFSHIWQCRFGASDRHLILQGTFTKHYLTEKGIADIWEGAGTYNQVIFMVNTTYENPWGAIARSGLALSTHARATMGDRLRRSGCDDEVAAYIANRVGDLRPWTRPDHALQKQLAVAFMSRLQPEVIRDPLTTIMIMINSTYDMFLHEMKNIKISD